MPTMAELETARDDTYRALREAQGLYEIGKATRLVVRIAAAKFGEAASALEVQRETCHGNALPCLHKF